jgi:hypothetical protein
VIFPGERYPRWGMTPPHVFCAKLDRAASASVFTDLEKLHIV